MEQFNDFDITNPKDYKFHNHSHSKISPTSASYSTDHHINNLACSNPSMVFERASLFFNECRDMEKTLQNCKLPATSSCACDKSDTDITNKLHWNDYHQQTCCGKLSTCKPSFSFIRTNNPSNILSQELQQSDYKNLPLTNTSYYNLDTIKYSSENLSNIGIETTRHGSICAFTLITLVLICIINNILRVSTYVLEYLQIKVQIGLRYFTKKSDTLQFQKDDYITNAVKFTCSTIKYLLHGSNVVIYWTMIISELLCKPVPPRYMNKITSGHFIEKY